MQEMKKRRIVLASLLKPVDDTRMYEKLGATLALNYEVTIIGQPSASTSQKGNPEIVPLPRFERLSLKRLLAPFKVLRTVLHVRPQLLIICTAELLPMALVARILCGVRIVYDVQENYAVNIVHGNAWPRMVRPLLSGAVKAVEWCSSLMISHFLLAEKSYAKELSFIGNRFTTIQNKVVRPDQPFERQPPALQSYDPHNEQLAGKHIRLLFSGTLASTTGVFDAIDLSKHLYDSDSNVRLHIIGYAAQTTVRTRLRTLAGELPFIQLEGIDELVPHDKIREAVERAHFGIISYPENVSTWASYPTKLYEYLGYRLPVLLVNNPRWVDYCVAYAAAVVFDPGQVDPHALLGEMTNRSFYTAGVPEVYWDSEAPKLLQVVSSLIS
jgi:hypothetical protein